MITPKHALGQNFLTDRNIVNKLVETANIERTDTVLEVGAGTGNVTKELAKRAARVIAVEFDSDLVPVLKNNLQKHDNLTLINKDILNLDLAHLEITKIVGSIPFQITSPLIHKLLGAGFGSEGGNLNFNDFPQKLAFINSPPPEITILIQKEVAEKITAQPPNANYLSNFAQGLANVTYIQTVHKTAFHPQPKVDGAIIKIEPHYNVLVNHNISPAEWQSFLHQGFQHPRKMLRNVFDEDSLKDSSIDPRARPQEIDVSRWCTLYKATNKKSSE